MELRGRTHRGQRLGGTHRTQEPQLPLSVWEESDGFGPGLTLSPRLESGGLRIWGKCGTICVLQ